MVVDIVVVVVGCSVVLVLMSPPRNRFCRRFHSSSLRILLTGLYGGLYTGLMGELLAGVVDSVAKPAVTLVSLRCRRLYLLECQIGGPATALFRRVVAGCSSTWASTWTSGSSDSSVVA